jgi:hypothetical protein
MPNATVVFAEVKAILDQTIADWKLKNGSDPDLLGAHATNIFSWNTADELKNSTALGLQLIQLDVIGKNPKKGQKANLVIALKTGVSPHPRMPAGGPFRTDGEIQVIIDWIDGGCKP